MFAAAAGLIVVLATNVQRTGPYGTFSGYDYLGRVTSIAASWRVPRTLGGAADSSAATWIGVQSQRSPAQFVQIGTQEQGSGRDFAFWSDAKHGFLPQFLGDVNPGDRVRVSIGRSQGGWALVIADPAARIDRAFDVRQTRLDSFDQAEWLQEDPTASANGTPQQPIAYPQLTPVRFDDLSVNATAPDYRDLLAQWMSLPGEITLAPTPLEGGGFTIHAVKLGAVRTPHGVS